MSHPTVGVALFGPNVSSRLSEKLPYRSFWYYHERVCFRTSAYLVEVLVGLCERMLSESVSGEMLSFSC